MADLWRFVSAISEDATVRLDLNDEDVSSVREVVYSPPRLRRSTSQNMMSDGWHQGPSSVDGRFLSLSLDLIAVSQDASLEFVQALARELDRETNFLEHRPAGATFSVFYKTYRADFESIVDVPAAVAFRQVVVPIPADPYAYGLRETVSVGTVNNDPAAGSNGCYFDVSNVKGDALAPMLLTDTQHPGVATATRLYLGARQTGSPASMQHFVQAESGNLGTDTTNPGGGPDAAMSGTGTNNYVRCSFATVATMDIRWSYTPTAGDEVAGRYRLLGVVRRSSGTGIIKMRAGTASALGTVSTGATVTTTADTNRNLIDLGIVELAAPASGGARSGTTLVVEASRETGTSTLDFDCFHLVPADTASAIVDVYYQTTGSIVLDGLWGGELYWSSDNNPFSGTAKAHYLADLSKQDYVGKIPLLAPGVVNRFVWLKSFGAINKSSTSSLTLYYYPRHTLGHPLGT